MFYKILRYYIGKGYVITDRCIDYPKTNHGGYHVEDTMVILTDGIEKIYLFRSHTITKLSTDNRVSIISHRDRHIHWTVNNFKYTYIG